MKTLAELLAEFLAHKRALLHSWQTLRQSGFINRSFLRWLQATHGVVTPDRLRSVHLASWQRHLLGWRTTKGLPLKAVTVNVRLRYARSWLRWLGKRGAVPARLLESLEYLHTTKLLPQSVLDHAQMRKMLSAIDTSNAQGVRDRAMLEMLYTSGIRARELVGLNLAAVSIEQATAVVLGKGGKERVVPIGKTALRWLESYLKGVRPFVVRDPAQPALWLSRLGQRLGYEPLRLMVRRYAAQAGLPATVTAHTFRRSCTTELVKSGGNPWHIKELLGHANLDTLQHYARLTIVDLKKTHAKCHPRERENG